MTQIVLICQNHTDFQTEKRPRTCQNSLYVEESHYSSGLPYTVDDLQFHDML